MNQGQSSADPSAKLYFGTLAADSLMHGQMHNPLLFRSTVPVFEIVLVDCLALFSSLEAKTMRREL